MAKPRVLFVCSANISRSRTAEDLFKDSCDYEVQSAGFRMEDHRSGQLVTQELVDWADSIFLMDEDVDQHLTRLIELFELEEKRVGVLGIPDIYGRGDPVLIRLLKVKLAKYGIMVSDGKS